MLAIFMGVKRSSDFLLAPIPLSGLVHEMNIHSKDKTRLNRGHGPLLRCLFDLGVCRQNHQAGLGQLDILAGALPVTRLRSGHSG